MKCADVTFDMGDGSYEKDTPWWEGGGIGSLIWNPKGGEGHVIVAEVKCGDMIGLDRYPRSRADCGCGGHLGACHHTALVCECGEDNAWRDHHYRLLRRAAA